MLKFLGKFICWSSALALIISALASFISPDFLWWFGLLGLAFPFIFLLNVVLALFWLIRQSKLFFLSLIAVVIGIPGFNKHFAINGSTEANAPIKIMSFNTRVFNLYGWMADNPKVGKLMWETFDNENLDIVCFQEYFRCDDLSYFPTLSKLKKVMKVNTVHEDFTANFGPQHFGIGTISTYPIVGKGRVPLKDAGNNICIFTDLQINGDTVRVYNLHLASIQFQKEDYEFMLSVNENESDEQIDKSKKILKRLKGAFIKRADQARNIKVHVNHSPYPVIVCGDFNDTPGSYTYHTLADNLEDSFIESGNGLGGTYNGFLPAFRIDFILHDNSYNSYNFRVVKEDLSDHYPIVCELSKNE